MRVLCARAAGVCITREGLAASWKQLLIARGRRTGDEKSAEHRSWTSSTRACILGIVGGLDSAEGLNMNDVEGNRGFDDEGETG